MGLEVVAGGGPGPQQERQWRQERESIERGHRQTVTALEHEKEDLRREQAELQLRVRPPLSFPPPGPQVPMGGGEAGSNLLP